MKMDRVRHRIRRLNGDISPLSCIWKLVDVGLVCKGGVSIYDLEDGWVLILDLHGHIANEPLDERCVVGILPNCNWEIWIVRATTGVERETRNE